MSVSEEVADERDTMIAIGYLFVYDADWQDVPVYLHKDLTRRFAQYDIPASYLEPETIEKRWNGMQMYQNPVLEYWSIKSKDDEEVREYCYKWGMWV